MNVICPNCQKKVKITPDYRSKDDTVFEKECPDCQAVFQVTLDVKLLIKKQTDKSQHTVQVVVAVEGEATRELIREVLVRAGYEPLEAATGREALSLLEKHCPPIAILDVELPQMFGFQVCEVIKRKDSLKSVKVILVTAIHDKDTYKREPRTLYGADDYVERYRLQEELIPKIERLLDSKKPSVIGPKQDTKQQDAVQKAPMDQQQEPFPGTEKPRTMPAQDKAQSSPHVKYPDHTTPEHESAKRLARIIVSDIALYNPDRVREALQGNSFFEFLKEEIDEGRKLYNERVSATVRSNTDYFQDALESFVRSRANPHS
jgi:CheY-like chemotaxis protein